ncbi:uncharacterized protein [Nicotiana tomentosiformis]|uniref:uncharacterized protein n=1 Tax=Nicotiana tomentosiformis TaxID=4098 RepID=UPI00388CDC1A
MGHRHPGFSWSSPGGNANTWQQNNSRPQGQEATCFQNQQWQQYHPPQSNQSSTEDLIKTFIIKTDARLDTHGATIRELGMAFRNLERQDELIERHIEIVEEQKNDNIQEVAGMVDDGLKKKGETRAQKKKKDENAINEETEESKSMHALPFPQKQGREKWDKQFGRFLQVLKKVHVNILFTEVLSQMPAYAKYLKEILSKKKLEGEIGEIRSTHVSLQLADQTTIILEVIVEDMLVWVDKFVFPVDFIVMNMEENREAPLILGRPLLATGRAILDIQERQLMLRVREERVIFKMERARGA